MPPGDQPESGPGWRLLADQDQVGEPYRTGIAADAEAYAVLWGQVGLAGEPPPVDFTSEVVIWFGAVHGSSCPRLRLDDVVVEPARSVVHAEIVALDIGGACTSDAIGHAYVVAVERVKLPSGSFTIQLQAADPPPGAIQEKTIVDADLSAPGSTVGPDQLHTAPPLDGPPVVNSGGVVEPGFSWPFRMAARCGIEWLGELNSVSWRTSHPGAALGQVPLQWQRLLQPDGTIEVSVLLVVDPEPRVEASANGLTVIYRPSPGDAPVCR